MSAALLFDLDGCLVDSTPVITACLDHALVTSAGHASRDPDELRWAVGPPLLRSVQQLLGPDADPRAVTACIDAYRDRYRASAGTLTAVFDGIPALLDDLATVATLAVVTSQPQPIASWLLGEVGLADRFVAIHGPGVEVEGEPKHETLVRALASLGVDDPATATMIGDRSHDVAAGRQVGTATVGVTWGAGDRAELEGAGADVIVDHVDALREVLAAR